MLLELKNCIKYLIFKANRLYFVLDNIVLFFKSIILMLEYGNVTTFIINLTLKINFWKYNQQHNGYYQQINNKETYSHCWWRCDNLIHRFKYFIFFAHSRSI